jgi:hypothetical protein
MNDRTLEPAVRDLLVAIADAVDAAKHPDEPIFAISSVCQSVVRYGLSWGATAWLHEQTAELADRRRVTAADTHGLLAEGLVPVRPGLEVRS